MKKLILLVSAVAVSATMFSSCGGSVNLKTEKDSVAYSIGIDLGNYIKNLNEDLDINVIANAMKDVLAENEKIHQDSAFSFLREYFMVRKPARAKVAAQEYLEKVEKENRNIQKTESGLLYEIIEAGDPNVKAVNDADKVKVVYEGKLKDDTVFDSSIERGDTAEFALNRVIKGWTEGMKLVGKGGKVKLYIPAELGYGERGTPNGKVGPNEPLIFDVTVVDVIPTEVTEE